MENDQALPGRFNTCTGKSTELGAHGCAYVTTSTAAVSHV